MTSTEVKRLAGSDVRLREHAGEGPVVLFCGGAGVVAEYWDPVTALLPDLHWVTLDRPGLGGTAWSGTTPTLSGVVDLLAAAVEDRGGPAVLVAQSMAGYAAEALARRHPRLVAGVVLVDTTVSFPLTPPREVGLTAARAVHRLARWRPVQRLGGLVHRTGAALLTSEPALVRRRPVLLERYTDADALATAVAEYSSYRGQGWDLLGVRSAHPYPPVPTVLLSSSTTGGRDWLARQNRLARLLGARQVVVDDGRHMLMVDRPEPVATAVRSVRPPAG